MFAEYIAGNICFDGIAIDDIIAFAVYTKYNDVLPVECPGIMSRSMNIYGDNDSYQTIFEVVVEPDVPEITLFTYCLLNCNIDVSHIRIRRLEEGKIRPELFLNLLPNFHLSPEFELELLHIVREYHFQYTKLFYILMQMQNIMSQEGLDELRNINYSELGTPFAGNLVYPLMDDESEIGYSLIDSVIKFESGVIVDYDTLFDTELGQLWLPIITTSPIKSARY